VNITCSSKDTVYNHIPKKLNQSDDAVYLHITSNNTIYGTQWHEFPKPINDGYLVADMSSDILSRSIDISRFGLIYAGAQKNIGPAGVTMVILRDEILDKVNRKIPTMMKYRTHIDKGSMFNTPPVISIFAVNRTLVWLKSIGGIDFIEKKNKLKAQKLYDEIDNNELFSSPVNVENRSMMNIPFVFTQQGDELSFLSFCKKRGLLTLKGHRSVGGFRASIYNAMPEEGVETLIQAMKEYEPN
jgi:phosphoserine aminotransferase